MVTDTVPQEQPGPRSDLPPVPPKDTEQDWGCQQGPHPAVLSPTTCSRSSSQTLGKQLPAALPSSATSFPTSRVPWAGPVTNPAPLWGLGTRPVWLFWVWECFGGSTRLSQMILSTWCVFSCLPSVFRWQFPAASPATLHHLQVLCHVCILISPHSLPKASALVWQLWVAVPAQRCPTLIPWPLPPSPCLYITLE